MLNRLLTRKIQRTKQLTDNTVTQLCACTHPHPPTHTHTERVRFIPAAPPVVLLVLYALPGRCPGFPGVSTLLWRSVTHEILIWGREVITDHDLTWVDEGWDKHALTEGRAGWRWPGLPGLVIPDPSRSVLLTRALADLAVRVDKRKQSVKTLHNRQINQRWRRK